MVARRRSGDAGTGGDEERDDDRSEPSSVLHGF
jgi:hypothetical protein